MARSYSEHGGEDEQVGSLPGEGTLSSPSVVNLSEEGPSLRPSTGMRQPAEVTPLWISDTDIEMFTDVIKVRTDTDDGYYIEGDPTEWLAIVGISGTQGLC